MVVTCKNSVDTANFMGTLELYTNLSARTVPSAQAIVGSYAETRDDTRMTYIIKLFKTWYFVNLAYQVN
jgi:hypothetical protein